MEPIHITYQIKLNPKVTEVFDFVLDGKTFELISETVSDPPHWTALDHCQCSNCPLNKEQHPHCPLALQLHDIVRRLDKTRSIDEVEVEVITEERSVRQTTAIQRVVASMLGLIFPICGCPKTAYMRPLARFHVPLASEEETVFHVAGMYLLAQYFLHNTGTKGEFDFKGLVSIYEDLHILNTAMNKRLQAATRSDTTINAVTLLDMYATLIPMLVEDHLVEMRNFFNAYLPADAPVVKPKHNYLEKAKAFTLELVPLEDGSSAKPTSGKARFGLQEDDEDELIPTLATTPAPAEAPKAPAFSLSLSLEPLPGEKPAAPASEKKKATFVLPDDPPPPKKN